MKKKKIAVIYAGRKEGRCRQVYDTLIQKLDGQQVSLIDLSETNVNFEIPEGYKSERPEEVKEMSQTLIDSDLLIFVYPLQWFNLPAKLKGFIDSTIWVDEAFSFKHKAYYSKGYFKGKEAVLIYTQGGNEWFHRLHLRMGVNALAAPLKTAGVKPIRSYHLDDLNRSSFRQEQFDLKVDELVDKIVKKHVYNG